ncbi:hypothetical protein DFQ30_001510, partial [Apophysomyces sp. BC1015]
MPPRRVQRAIDALVGIGPYRARNVLAAHVLAVVREHQPRDLVRRTAARMPAHSHVRTRSGCNAKGAARSQHYKKQRPHHFGRAWVKLNPCNRLRVSACAHAHRYTDTSANGTLPGIRVRMPARYNRAGWHMTVDGVEFMTRASKTAHADRVLEAIEHGASDSDTPVPRLLSSWHRSLQLYGIDPASQVSPRILTEYELRQIQDQEEDFLLASGQYLSRLHDTLRTAGYCVLLANAQGVTLDHRVDPHLRHQHKDAGLYIGSCWSEQEQGTCGIGSALAECAPMTVHKIDHFRTLFTTLTCTAAPVLGLDGKLIGVLVQHTAQRIEDGYFVKQTAQWWLLLGHDNPHFVEVSPEVLIAFDDAGIIVAANREAKQRFPVLASGVATPISMLFDVRDADLLPIDGPHRITALRSRVMGDVLYARMRAPQARTMALGASPLALSNPAPDASPLHAAPAPIRVFLDSRDPVMARNARIALRLS